MAFTIDIQDRATPAVEGALSELQLAGVKPVIGRAVVQLVQHHFLRLNSSRANPLGGPRSNFYAQAARNTRYDVLTDGVLVSVSQIGIRQRLEGGEILPRNAKYLALPAIAEAYGKRAREFPNLTILWRRIAGATRPVALVEAAATPFTRPPANWRAGPPGRHARNQDQQRRRQSVVLARQIGDAAGRSERAADRPGDDRRRDERRQRIFPRAPPAHRARTKIGTGEMTIDHHCRLKAAIRAERRLQAAASAHP